MQRAMRRNRKSRYDMCKGPVVGRTWFERKGRLVGRKYMKEDKMPGTMPGTQ